jgi:1-acylglycerone phosphate reductase
MPLLDTSLDAMREVFELNVFAVLAMTQAFAPSLIKAKGKVINIGSIVGKMAQPFAGLISTSASVRNCRADAYKRSI